MIPLELESTYLPDQHPLTLIPVTSPHVPQEAPSQDIEQGSAVPLIPKST